MSASAAVPLVPVSWGELIDKITILEIKRQRIRSPGARENVVREHKLLGEIAAPVLGQEGVPPLLARLRSVNEALWEIEEAIRIKEAEADFGSDFVRLA